MNKIYQARVLKGGGNLQGDMLASSTSVYADNPLDAKLLAAEQLGVTPDQVIVEEIPGVGNPSDEELNATWAARAEELARLEATQEHTGGSAYD